MTRRGLTLLELAVALGLALALAASLAVPSMGWVRRWRAEHLGRQVAAALDQCRAEALRQGMVVRAVVTQPSASAWTIRAAVDAAGAGSDAGGPSAEPNGGSVGLAPGGSEPWLEPRAAAVAGRRVLELPMGVRLTPADAVEPAVGGAAGAPGAFEAPANETETMETEALESLDHESPAVTLAVFLPDGTAASGGEWLLAGERGGLGRWRVRVAIDAVTGRVSAHEPEWHDPAAAGTDEQDADFDADGGRP